MYDTMQNPSGIKIAIASGKGGTGKTLIATNLFHSLAWKGINVTLVDCDAEAPNAKLFFKLKEVSSVGVTQKIPVINENLCTYCGECHDNCHYGAIFFLPNPQVIKIMEELCHGCGACVVACNHMAIKEKDIELGTVSTYGLDNHYALIESRTHTGVYSPVPVIKAAIREAPDQRVTIVDAPPGSSCPFIHSVLKANYVVLVTEPTPFGLSNLQQAVETLRQMNKSFGVIINRAGLGNHDVYDYLKNESIKLLMEISFHREIASIYARGALLAEIDPGWRKKFLDLFDTIILQNGNIDHQR
jgi:MinD superfamily P-loop ATPase